MLNEMQAHTGPGAPPDIPEVPVSSVRYNEAGAEWREFLIRLPKGMTIEDCRNPAAWRKVQADRNAALIKLDRLMVLSYDEDRYAEMICSYANKMEAVVVPMRAGSFRDPDNKLFSDGTYEVIWAGGGYGVQRIKGQVRIGGDRTFPTEQVAISYINSLYPTRL